MTTTSIHHGQLNLPGATPQSKQLVESLLHEDRTSHHALYSFGLHNHLSHHLLAAYDLGAPTELLQAVYDENKKPLEPLHKTTAHDTQVLISKHNWKDFLGSKDGPSPHYASYLTFFTNEIAERGVSQTFETYLLDTEDGSDMLSRFVAGLPSIDSNRGKRKSVFISDLYGVEFGSEVMVAQGLAQTAIHNPSHPSIFPFSPYSPSKPTTTTTSSTATTTPTTPLTLHQIINLAYASPSLHPVMPYDPTALLSARTRDALSDGTRAAEIRRLADLWFGVAEGKDSTIAYKIKELTYLSTLLLVSTSKPPPHKPRLDFFLMHILNASLFLTPLLLQRSGSPRGARDGFGIASEEGKEKLLKAFLATVLLTLVVRGRPRVDYSLMEGYTSSPIPPSFPSPTSPLNSTNPNTPKPDPSTLSPHTPNPNPWPAIISSVLHAPDAHVVKAVRTLAVAAREFGFEGEVEVEEGKKEEQKETEKDSPIPPLSHIPGTIFIKAAGVVMDVMGWTGYPEPKGKVGSWDRSALGWEGAWEDGK